ncbi:MAG: hypothetical protein PHS46_08150 [Candidatus Omnitrophica bacterium]|nr:hypothetical protein [Candidatus Omnitrophota bacterium]
MSYPVVVETSMPRIHISVHTSYGTFYISHDAASNGRDGGAGIDDLLISCSTGKTLASPVGTFNIVLTRKKVRVYKEDGVYSMKSFHEIVSPYDIVIISMKQSVAGADGKWETVMIGFAKRIFKTTSFAQDGKPQLAVVISGVDFGQLFIQQQIVRDYRVDQNASLLPAGFSWLGSEIPSKGNIRDLVQMLFLHWMRVVSPVTHNYWTSNISIADMIYFISDRFATEYFLPGKETLQAYTGAVWNLMLSMTNEPWTEVFFDTRSPEEFNKDNANKYDVTLPSSFSDPITASASITLEGGGSPIVKDKLDEAIPGDNYPYITGRPMLVLRHTPFVTRRDDYLWYSLKNNKIADIDVISDNTGRSDDKVFNFFYASLGLIGNNTSAIASIIVEPLLNIDSMIKHGFRPLEVTSRALTSKAFEDDGKGMRALAILLTEKLFDWNFRNDEYEEGTMQLRGNPELRIGQRITNTDALMQYYIQSVQHDYVNMQSFTTSVEVVKGMPTINGDRLKDEWTKNGIAKKAVPLHVKQSEEQSWQTSGGGANNDMG